MNSNTKTVAISKTCRYCGNVYTKKDGEHVFPYGLGGENLYIDCVCEQCNNYFSGLELELYQKSFLGLMRSTIGVEGYTPNARNRSPFKAPVLLSFDEKNQIVFEIGQQFRMQVFVRPQIFAIGGKYYVEADSMESKQLFADAFVKWKKENGVLTACVEKKIIHVKFTIADGHYSRLSEPVKKDVKKPIQYCTLPEDHHLYDHLSPRLFIDDDEKLKIRARTLVEAEIFLEDLLNDTLFNNQYGSFSGSDLNSPIVHVGFSFDSVKFQQALVKIGLNCLIYYFPQIKENPSLNPYIGYVMHGTHGIKGGMEAKDQLMDSVPETHNIFFSSWEGNVRVRISLFSGQFVFAFWIENLPLLGHNSYHRLLIDYQHRQHTFQDTIAFLKSFPVGSQANEPLSGLAKK
ncbi:hypothetical protein JN11_03409 [Mucilaginibacter frigoritolerans]|uniref:HNH endonuclease n=1 Tax=Mucilaginibacter frigoritolerans TaxID=652788 RepID=A0A562TVK7_9SPHI|nr:HNH endonuclease [Mucilaginibacter frigoritolerans]TWI97587.1 hypothetical protein JN11_03409 [Mucilaginibacter frigoritolerans]